MKDLKISEIVTIKEGKVKPRLKYKSGSVRIFYNKAELNYIEINNNELMIIEKDNTIVNTIEGKAFSLICDDEGALETIEFDTTKTFEVDLNKYKINTDSEGCLYTTKNQNFESVTVTPNTKLEGKKVTIKYLHTTEDNTLVFTKNTKADSLFYAYGKESLMYNHVYTYTLNIKDTEYSTDFVTKLNPYFCSVDKIRKDTGELLDHIKDDVISYLIYTNSKIVNEILVEKEVEDIPTYVKQYVRYKTDMDLVNTVYLTLSGKAGQTNKKIGIIQVDKSIKIPFVKDMLYYFKDLYKKYEDMVDELGEEQLVGSFVKAGSTSYPYDGRVNF